MPRARILAIAFSLLLGLPAVVSVITDHDARSRWENRPLADLPGPVDVLEADRWFAGLERFLEDRLGFAIPLNRIHRRLLLHGFQVSPAEDVTMGKADFLFVTSYRSYPFSILEELCVGSLEPGRARAAGETWTALMEHFSSSHQRVFLLIVPSKPTLYPEQLSSAVPRDYREKCADFRHGASAPGVIARQLSAQGYSVLYPFEAFRRLRYDGNFYPRQNFHVEGASAHWLGRETLRTLGVQPGPDYDESFPGRFETSDLSNVLGFKRRIDRLEYPYRSFGLAEAREEPPFVGDFYRNALRYGTWTSERPLTGRTAAVIGNSFTQYVAGHLAPGYEKLVYIMANDLEPGEVERFFGDMLPRIEAEDLIFVFNDNGVAVTGAMWLEALRDAGVIR